MACEAYNSQLTAEQRAREIKDALEALERQLRQDKVRVKVGPQGAIALEGWKDGERKGLTDACTIRRLKSKGSSVLRQKIAAAERKAGRKVSQKQVRKGTHSHDGGKSWSKGH